ncbi:MAG: hypothetical protein AB7O52_02505 [Planctomycetota bacterium]
MVRAHSGTTRPTLRLETVIEPVSLVEWVAATQVERIARPTTHSHVNHAG